MSTLNSKRVSIIDYGCGNSASVARMVERAGGEADIIKVIDDIDSVGKVIIPGVGAFDHGMSQLKNSNLFDQLNVLAMDRKIPILGICLGMQLMCKGSDEGNEPGFGWLNADVRSFNKDLFQNKELKIPHMGWNTIHTQKNSRIFASLESENRFYFVHSYYVDANEKEDILGTTDYGIEFVSAFQKDNIFGVQFHPEKSHRFGLSLIRNFIEI